MKNIQNYARINTLSLAQYIEILFIKMHQMFIEAIPHELKKLIDHINEKNRPNQ